MAVQKTYQVVGTLNMRTRHMKFMVEIVQGDKTFMVPRYITLKGHLKPRKKGELTTSEPALIKAIDRRIERAGAKAGIICVNEVKIPDKDAEQSPLVVETMDGDIRFEDEVRPSEVKTTFTPQVEVVGGMSNVQEARDYLLKKFDDVTTREVSNKGLVLKVAQEKNINFVDLK